jgi:sugar phosphate isomerase/epimerase
MFKNLSPDAIGIFGRQGEMLEIALTHRFQGLEIDITEVTKRAKAASVAQACKYLASARVRIGGFELPIRWSAEETQFRNDLAQVGTLIEVCKTIGADRCYTTIRPTCEERPMHENFQFHVDRLRKVADAIAPADLKLGLTMLPSPADRKDGGFEFIHQVDPLLLLLNTVQKANVGLLLDTWVWTVGGGDLDKLRSLRGDQIISVRLGDMPAEADVASIQPQQKILPSAEGGAIDNVAYLGLLEELGFDGPVTVAQHNSHMKGQAREPIVARSSSLLDGLMAAAGITTAGTLASAK